MSFLIDTNVVSEWVKPRPNPGVVRWLTEVDEDAVFMSVVSFGEIRRGIDRLPVGARRTALDAWLALELLPRFDGRILPVDLEVADSWGRLMAARDAAGRPLPTLDALLPATALVHGLTIVTRNVADFGEGPPRLLDPWT